MASLKELAGIANELRTASTSGGGNWFKPGKGVVIIDRMYQKKGFKGLKFKAEFMVESSQAIEAGKEPNMPGSRVTKMESLDGPADKKQSALGRIKALMFVLSGKSEGELSEEEKDAIIDECSDSETACRGTRVAYETYQTVTGKGIEITAVNFFPIPNQTEAMCADAIRKLEAIPQAAADSE